MRLKDKVAVITGAGAGIGEAIAVRFAEEGAKLLLNDIQESSGQGVLEKIRAMGAQAELVVADISQEEGAKSLAERAVAAFGGIDIVVNNAADFTQLNVETAEVADWRRVLGVNVIGLALVSKYAIPHLKQRRGAIVNIGSMSGFIAQPNFSTYSASKGAVVNLTRSMALDLAPFQVRVNAVCPGCILTSASHREIQRLGLTFEQWRDAVVPRHMLKRLGTPREVAHAALFLASEESSFITGENLMVDGGYTAH
ncbi:MAG: glucose 1-dehydrogenase [Acidobacteriia bacterium]|nr:glucose 1-dehydrogenase [Terriglobia bacterium]